MRQVVPWFLAVGVVVLSFGMSVQAGGESGKPQVSPYGPCYVASPDVFELVATGTCKCTDGTCRQVSCSGAVSGSLEFTKQKLKVELEGKIRQLGGVPEGEVTFRLVKKQ